MVKTPGTTYKNWWQAVILLSSPPPPPNILEIQELELSTLVTTENKLWGYWEIFNIPRFSNTGTFLSLFLMCLGFFICKTIIHSYHIQLLLRKFNQSKVPPCHAVTMALTAFGGDKNVSRDTVIHCFTVCVQLVSSCSQKLTTVAFLCCPLREETGRAM